MCGQTSTESSSNSEPNQTEINIFNEVFTNLLKQGFGVSVPGVNKMGQSIISTSARRSVPNQDGVFTFRCGGILEMLWLTKNLSFVSCADWNLDTLIFKTKNV